MNWVTIFSKLARAHRPMNIGVRGFGCGGVGVNSNSTSLEAIFVALPFKEHFRPAGGFSLFGKAMFIS